MTSDELKYFRYNVGDGFGTPPTRLTEIEARRLLGASFKNVDAAIKKLAKGKEIRTKFATYKAQPDETPSQMY